MNEKTRTWYRYFNPSWPVRLVTWLIVIPLVMAAFLYLWQDRLLFFPQPLTKQRLQWLEQAYPGSQIRSNTADGHQLHGWHWRPAETVRADDTILYFGGNAEEISYQFEELTAMGTHAVVAVNYRGYGLSSGRPSEKALLADALTLYDELTSYRGVEGERLVVMGRSLGTGVATWLASQRTVKAVILLSPYDSMLAVAQRHYPFMPVKWLLRHRFDSLAQAGKIRAPLLAIAGHQDQIVPLPHTQRLLAAWGGESRLVIIEGAGHNDLTLYPSYQAALTGFLQSLENAGQRR